MSEGCETITVYEKKGHDPKEFRFNVAQAKIKGFGNDNIQKIKMQMKDWPKCGSETEKVSQEKEDCQCGCPADVCSLPLEERGACRCKTEPPLTCTIKLFSKDDYDLTGEVVTFTETCEWYETACTRELKHLKKDTHDGGPSTNPRKPGKKLKSYQLIGDCKEVELVDDDDCEYDHHENFKCSRSWPNLPWDVENDVCKIKIHIAAQTKPICPPRTCSVNGVANVGFWSSFHISASPTNRVTTTAERREFQKKAVQETKSAHEEFLFRREEKQKEYSYDCIPDADHPIGPSGHLKPSEITLANNERRRKQAAVSTAAVPVSTQTQAKWQTPQGHEDALDIEGVKDLAAAVKHTFLHKYPTGVNTGWPDGMDELGKPNTGWQKCSRKEVKVHACHVHEIPADADVADKISATPVIELQDGSKATKISQNACKQLIFENKAGIQSALGGLQSTDYLYMLVVTPMFWGCPGHNKQAKGTKEQQPGPPYSNFPRGFMLHSCMAEGKGAFTQIQERYGGICFPMIAMVKVTKRKEGDVGDMVSSNVALPPLAVHLYQDQSPVEEVNGKEVVASSMCPPPDEQGESHTMATWTNYLQTGIYSFTGLDKLYDISCGSSFKQKCEAWCRAACRPCDAFHKNSDTLIRKAVSKFRFALASKLAEPSKQPICDSLLGEQDRWRQNKQLYHSCNAMSIDNSHAWVTCALKTQRSTQANMPTTSTTVQKVNVVMCQQQSTSRLEAWGKC
jgi:hypothetical protein